MEFLRDSECGHTLDSVAGHPAFLLLFRKFWMLVLKLFFYSRKSYSLGCVFHVFPGRLLSLSWFFGCLGGSLQLASSLDRSSSELFLNFCLRSCAAWSGEDSCSPSLGLWVRALLSRSFFSRRVGPKSGVLVLYRCSSLIDLSAISVQ